MSQTGDVVVSPQLRAWSGDFGDKYVDRNEYNMLSGKLGREWKHFSVFLRVLRLT